VHRYMKQAGDVREDLLQDANNTKNISMFKAAQISTGKENMFYHFVPLLPNLV
jgi:hypothetical protein